MAEPRRPRRSFGDYRFLVFAFVVLAFFRLALLCFPYRIVSRWMPRNRDAVAPAWVRSRVRWAILRAAPLAPGATCLPQAMAAFSLLSLQGYDATIRIGVRRKPDGEIGAHAWVLCGEDVVVGDDDEGLEAFSPLVDLGRS